MKRGAGKVRGESVFQMGSDEQEFGLDQFADTDPTPEDAVAAIEEFRLRLESLDDDGLRKVALLKFQGFTNKEIADRIQRTIRTVEFRLQRIRERWEQVG